MNFFKNNSQISEFYYICINKLTKLSFSDPKLQGLYCHGTKSCDRFACKPATRKSFIMVINELCVAISLAEIMSTQHLRCEVADAEQSKLSVKVDSHYRLAFTYKEKDGIIIEIIVQHLSNVFL